MSQKKWMLSVASTLLVILLFAGFMAIAAELGSQQDPLVAVSYINEELTPKMLESIDNAISAKAASYADDLEKKMDSFRKEISGASSGGSATLSKEFIEEVAAEVSKQVSGGGGGMQMVSIPAGKTMTIYRNTEVLLRLGTATLVAADNPGLIDMTDASELAGNKQLAKNHLYLVTMETVRGIKATDKVTVFVRGKYDIK